MVLAMCGGTVIVQRRTIHSVDERVLLTSFAMSRTVVSELFRLVGGRMLIGSAKPWYRGSKLGKT